MNQDAPDAGPKDSQAQMRTIERLEKEIRRQAEILASREEAIKEGKIWKRRWLIAFTGGLAFLGCLAVAAILLNYRIELMRTQDERARIALHAQTDQERAVLKD